jgi:hypothetical protein
MKTPEVGATDRVCQCVALWAVGVKNKDESCHHDKKQGGARRQGEQRRDPVRRAVQEAYEENGDEAAEHRAQTSEHTPETPEKHGTRRRMEAARREGGRPG